MKIQIKHRFSGSVLYETDAASLGVAILAAVAVKANLCGADLCGANLCGANLCGADLCGADLCGANLCGADLCGADLCGADLCGANLCGANLCNADLCGANLCGANLCGANLCGANLLKLLAQRTILPDGVLIAWKKVRNIKDGEPNVVIKLSIPAKAKRIGGLVGRKCRAEFVKVLAGSGKANHNGGATVYRPGKVVRPDSYDPNPLVECSNGIHFFITKAEAEAYEL